MMRTAMYPKFRGGGTIEFEERSVPEPARGQLLIQCKANALCASELEFYHGGTDISLGHEAAGIVAACGPGTSAKEGTHGVIFLMDFCEKCRSCSLGFTNQCLEKRADYGFTHDGGYGPYMLVNENVFFAVDDDVDLTEATMLLDIMGTGSHALKKTELVHPDPESLLVLGAGPIGLGLIAMAKIRLGTDFPVMVTDMVEYRLELAASLGALPINLKNESLDSGMNRQGYQQADVAIDRTGKISARREALDQLAKRGVLICVGHGEGLNLTISPDLIATERAILGSEYFQFEELNGNYQLFRKHREYLSPIITHRLPISKIGDAFELFIQRNTGKVVVEQ